MMFPSIAQAASALEPAWSWPHFRIPELACRCGGKFCGGEYWHMPDFLDALEALREKMEKNGASAPDQLWSSLRAMECGSRRRAALNA